MTVTLLTEFKSQSIHRIELNTPRIDKCMELLRENDTWKKPNESSNSIANLILHLCGNMTQYVISSLGNKEDRRERDKEFSVTGGLTKQELQQKLHATVADVTSIIRNISEEDLLKTKSVQGFEYTGVGIILHVTEHYSYHTGQIALITKLITNKDLGFYKGYDLNKKNKL
jgi:uncharacterized damage-inducible protein DinB